MEKEPGAKRLPQFYEDEFEEFLKLDPVKDIEKIRAHGIEPNSGDIPILIDFQVKYMDTSSGDFGTIIEKPE